MKYLLIGLIKIYQKFSKHTPASCRFYPSCSRYALESIEKHGSLKGLTRSLIRVSKCHPYHPGGYDPVR